MKNNAKALYLSEQTAIVLLEILLRRGLDERRLRLNLLSSVECTH